MRFPTSVEIIQLDNELAAEGVAIDERANHAMLRWFHRSRWSGEIIPIAKYFEERFRELHPSAKLDGKPFMFLCASARGVTYEYHPPLVLGRVTINPVDSLQITQTELERIWNTDPDSYWELFYQCCDCFDLFQTQLNVHFKDPEAAGNANTARDQLQASARQLVAAAADASLAQACCLSVELAGKAVLREAGNPMWGHDIELIFSKIVDSFPAATDADVRTVSRSMPSYVDVRYRPPALLPKEDQELYAKALFLCAEAFRRNCPESMYFGAVESMSVPRRKWK